MERLISHPRRVAFAFAALASLGWLLLPRSAAGREEDPPPYTAAVTSFHTSQGANAIHFATATLHLVNNTKRPLILGCDASKITVTDDQKIQYSGALVRGMGTVAGTTVDPKFVLPPGGSGDALIEVRARIAPTAIRGTMFALDLATREIESLPGNQFRLGAERAWEFTQLKNGAAPASDGKPSVDAGPFTASVLRSKVARAGRWLSLEMTMRLKNTSDKPLTLAYESGFGVDDQGNRFSYAPGDRGTSGIGVVSGTKADPQFVLAPGEAKEVRFTAARAPGREVAGTSLIYYVALQSLEVLPSNQIRSTRQFTLTFPGLSLN